MNRTYSKNYFEKYAALSLMKVLYVDEQEIIQSDRPDLKIKSEYGIEVTQALTPQEAVADKKKALYSMIHMNPFDHHLDDISFVFQKIEDALRRKEKKCKNYVSFPINGLYIFTHCRNLKQEDLEDFFNKYQFQNDFYDYIYLNCATSVYEYKRKENKITKYDYTLIELMDMNMIALEYEKHCHKVRREIILDEKES